jgi:hypothetical protein
VASAGSNSGKRDAADQLQRRVHHRVVMRDALVREFLPTLVQAGRKDA